MVSVGASPRASGPGAYPGSPGRSLKGNTRGAVTLVPPTMSQPIELILHLSGFPAYALVFLLPALESSAFVGFIFPGELAIILGGVLAFQGRVSLGGVLAAAIAGAVIGDSVGYAVG